MSTVAFDLFRPPLAHRHARLPGRCGARIAASSATARVMTALCRVAMSATLAMVMSRSDGFAQTPGAYPTKPIRLIVSSTAGSTNDMFARLIAPAIAQALGQNVVVDNRGGANGIPALNATAQAAPDGHTVMSAGNLLVLNGVLNRVAFDIRKAVDPIAQLSSQPYLLLTHPSLGVNSVKELVAYAKAKPGAIAYGSSGTGSVNHLGTALLSTRSGIDLVHVPYKGNALAILDLLSGRIQVLFATGATAAPHLKSAKIRALAISGAQRAPAFPDVPTVAESGIPGFDVTNAYVLYAPAGVPAPITQLLNRLFADAVHAPEVRAKLAPAGIDAGERRSLAELREQFLRDYTTWDQFIKSSGLKLD